MKRLLWILPLLLLFSCNNYRASRAPADWIYVSETGNDGTGDGSSGAPYATVSFACTQATAGDTVYVMAGTINQGTTQIVKPVGVSIYGAGAASHIISSYANASSLQAAIQCASTAGTTTDDNSTISHIRLTGNDITSTRAIYVGYRNNVQIHDCVIEDFKYSGIYIDASATYLTVFVTGIKIFDNIINNCSSREGAGGRYPGSLRLRGCDGAEVYGNTFDNTERARSLNGNTFQVWRCKRLDVHDNIFYRNDHEISDGGTEEWNFFWEEWNYKGDSRYYNNTHYGLAKFSLGGQENDIEEGCTFGYKVYGNQFLNETHGYRTVNGNTTTYYAICVEGQGHQKVDVYGNYIQKYEMGIELSTPEAPSGTQWPYNWEWDDIRVHNNVIEEVGCADFTYGQGVWIIFETDDEPYKGTYKNILIANNTITAADLGANTSNYGIYFDLNGTVTNLRVINNNVTGFASYAVRVQEHLTDSLTLNGFDAIYNCFNGNGNNSVYIEAGSRIDTSDIDVATGNITTAPAFQTNSLRLSSTSPCINAGLSVGLTSDYFGHRVPQQDTVDIGAHEYGDYLVKFGGKYLRDGNGKLKMIH